MENVGRNQEGEPLMAFHDMSWKEKARIVRSYLPSVYNYTDQLVASNHYGKIKRAMWDEVKRISNPK